MTDPRVSMILQSDVTDIVYLTWLVDTGAAQALLPAGLRPWQCGGKTPFTVLTYRHGHFGPSLAGPLRRLCPSPLQSNWRLYLDAPAGSVYFLENLMDNPLYVAGTRTFSDIMQTRWPARFEHARDGVALVTRIAPRGDGAPALSSRVVPHAARTMPGGFDAAFGSWESAVQALACQDAALRWSARRQALVRARIDLPIALDEVRPLEAVGEVACSLPERLGAAGKPFCFLVPRVGFRVLEEQVLDASEHGGRGVPALRKHSESP